MQINKIFILLKFNFKKWRIYRLIKNQLFENYVFKKILNTNFSIKNRNFIPNFYCKTSFNLKTSNLKNSKSNLLS